MACLPNVNRIRWVVFVQNVQQAAKVDVHIVIKMTPPLIPGK